MLGLYICNVWGFLLAPPVHPMDVNKFCLRIIFQFTQTPIKLVLLFARKSNIDTIDFVDSSDSDFEKANAL